MNCREAEKHIYLYGELSPREREETDRHIDTCAGCSRLLEAVKTRRHMIIAASQVPPELPDASAMTRSILEAVRVRQRKKQTVFNIILPEPSLKLLRYGMAMVSLLLVVMFVTEYSAGTQLARPYKVMPVRQNTELNSAAFHAAFVEKKETGKNKRTLFYERVMNCLYAPDGDCAGFRKQIAKLN